MSRLLTALCALLVAALPVSAVSVGSATASAPAERAGATLTVQAQVQGDISPVNPGLIGANQRWFDDADGAWRMAAGQIDLGIAELMRTIGIERIRYAGGTVANMWDFDAAKSETPTGCQTSGGFAATPFSGIDEDEHGVTRNGYTLPQHQRFLDQVGSGTNLMIPMVNATPEQARRYVEAVAAGLPDDQHRLAVEIGNEPYQDIQRYWRSDDDAKRLDQYINGGSQRQPDIAKGGYRNSLSLFAAGTCDLLRPAVVRGASDRTFRPRFVPFRANRNLAIRVTTARGSATWHWVQQLGPRHAGERVFTTDGSPATRVVFGDGANGKSLPRGATLAFASDYVVVDQPGFDDFYRALHQAELPAGIQLDVCSSWANSLDFVTRMKKLDRPYDCLAVHSYSSIGPRGSDQDRLGRLMTAATERERHLGALRSAMTAGHPARYLAVTEYGVLNSEKTINYFIDDLYRARLMLGQVRKGVQVGNISNFGTLWWRSAAGPVRSTKGYLVSWLHELAGEDVHKITTTNAAGIDAVATGDGGTIHLYVVNYGKSDWSPTLDIPDPGDHCVTKDWMQAGPGTRTEPTDDGTPNVLHRSPEPRTWADGTALRMRFGADSVSLVTLAPGGC